MLNQLPARVWNWFRGGNFPAGDDKFGAFPGVSTSTVMDAIFSPAVTGLSGLLQKSLRRISQSMMRATGLILCVNLLPTFWLLRAALPSEPYKGASDGPAYLGSAQASAACLLPGEEIAVA